VPRLPKPKPSPLQLSCARKACGAVVVRKRGGQRYCSKRCRDLDAMRRLRLRSANIAEQEKATEPQNTVPLPPYREALTSGLQSIDLTGVSEPVLDTYIRAFWRPIINVSGRVVSAKLLARIVHTETRPPVTARLAARTARIPVEVNTEEARCEPQH
jgi:hypothetical protein